VVFRPIDLYVITSTFLRFYVFFQNQKNVTFYVFAVFHTFSRTMGERLTSCSKWPISSSSAKSVGGSLVFDGCELSCLREQWV